MAQKMRLDVYLFASGLAASRTEAKSLILEGAVSVCGKAVMKPSYEVDGNSNDVRVESAGKRFASRGGLKLEAALREFSVDPKDRLALDVGASSGGFTDCLLSHGAAHVIAVDSGTGQLAESLRLDGRVTSVEGYNARYMKREDLDYTPDLAVMDVSFISATYIMPAVMEVLAPGGDFVCLIKPQFEVGRAGLGKGGIVRDEVARDAAVRRVLDFAREIGFVNLGLVRSPILGGDGNVEFLAHFKKR